MQSSSSLDAYPFPRRSGRVETSPMPPNAIFLPPIATSRWKTRIALESTCVHGHHMESPHLTIVSRSSTTSQSTRISSGARSGSLCKCRAKYSRGVPCAGHRINTYGGAHHTLAANDWATISSHASSSPGRSARTTVVVVVVESRLFPARWSRKHTPRSLDRSLSAGLLGVL